MIHVQIFSTHFIDDILRDQCWNINLGSTSEAGRLARRDINQMQPVDDDDDESEWEEEDWQEEEDDEDDDVSREEWQTE